MLLASDGPMIILSDGGSEGVPVTIAALAQAGVVLLISVAVIVANVIIIATFLTTPGPREVLRYYLLSLAAADLLAGVLLIPLSVYPAIRQQWVYGDAVCRAAGYGLASLWVISVYTFMWIGVDRYVAVTKPMRYETEQTPTRCQCWVAFTWVTAMLLCLPPVLGLTKPRFERDVLVCVLDWGGMAAYSATLAALVLGPSMITSAYTLGYIFVTLKKMRSGEANVDREFAAALSEQLAGKGHVLATALTVVFWASWTPYAAVRAYEQVFGWRLQIPFLHFGLFWLGVLNCFWKALLYAALSPSFRLGLRLFCMSLCCRAKDRQAQLILEE